MKFQVINKHDNPNRKELLKKELQHFKNHLQTLAWQSHTILSGLKEVQQRKHIEEKLKQLQAQPK